MFRRRGAAALDPGPPAPRPRTARRERRIVPARGTAIMEFALALPILLVLVFALIEFGHLIQARLIVANVSREGGSIASREYTVDPNLTGLLAAAGRPLDFTAGDGKIIVTRVTAGQSSTKTTPTITTQNSIGSMSVGSSIAAGAPSLGLPSNLYNHLVFKTAKSAAEIPDITVVEVFYRYRPITPVPYLVPGGFGLMAYGGGMQIASKAVF